MGILLKCRGIPWNSQLKSWNSVGSLTKILEFRGILTKTVEFRGNPTKIHGIPGGFGWEGPFNPMEFHPRNSRYPGMLQLFLGRSQGWGSSGFSGNSILDLPQGKNSGIFGAFGAFPSIPAHSLPRIRGWDRAFPAFPAFPAFFPAFPAHPPFPIPVSLGHSRLWLEFMEFQPGIPAGIGSVHAPAPLEFPRHRPGVGN